MAPHVIIKVGLIGKVYERNCRSGATWENPRAQGKIDNVLGPSCVAEMVRWPSEAVDLMSSTASQGRRTFPRTFGRSRDIEPGRYRRKMPV